MGECVAILLNNAAIPWMDVIHCLWYDALGDAPETVFVL